MNWKNFFTVWLEVIIQLGIITIILWLIKCIILKDSLDFEEVAIAYLFAETANNKYDKLNSM